MQKNTFTLAARPDTSNKGFEPIGLPLMSRAQAESVMAEKQTQGDGFTYVIINAAAI
jgi:hypothetical protein